jgi:hypothetical protein
MALENRQDSDLIGISVRAGVTEVTSMKLWRNRIVRTSNSQWRRL